jgi:hypothetical protein
MVLATLFILSIKVTRLFFTEPHHTNVSMYSSVLTKPHSCISLEPHQLPKTAIVSCLSLSTPPYRPWRTHSHRHIGDNPHRTRAELWDATTTQGGVDEFTDTTIIHSGLPPSVTSQSSIFPSGAPPSNSYCIAYFSTSMRMFTIFF